MRNAWACMHAAWPAQLCLDLDAEIAAAGSQPLQTALMHGGLYIALGGFCRLVSVWATVQQVEGYAGGSAWKRVAMHS